MMIPMLVALCSALTCQGDSPEMVFRKIEDSLEKATAFRISFDLEVARGGQVIGKASGSVLGKNVDKVNVQVNFREGMKTSIVSDGTRMRAIIDLLDHESDTLKGMKGNTAVALARGGIFFSQAALVPVFSPPLEKGQGVKEVLAVSKCAFGEEKDGHKALIYELKVHREGHAEATLWYDPKTLKPMKRVVTAKVEKRETIYTESFSKWEIDPDLPDAQFKSPPSK